MDRNRMWIVGSVLLMAIVLGAGWFLGIAPQLAAAASAEVQRAGVQAMNVTEETTLATLKKDYANLGELNAQLAALSDSVPSDTAIPAFVDEVDGAAAAAGVTVAGIDVADAQPYVPVSPPATASTAASTPAPTATPSAGTSPTATPTPAPTAVPGMPPVTNPKLTSANFSSLAVTLTVKGTYAQALSFVNAIQSGKRLFLVSGISTTSTATSTGAASHTDQETATITGLIFVVTPQDQSAPAAAANH